mmetsp:Transcript_14216/g.42249  ORF Transcript_14216/g.42249 Transcript_14216/m.42249 type:complete len:341 (+) Transcript_14216:1031-2053(+)
MPLGAARVVVVDESHGMLWHPAKQAGGLPVAILQSPVLAILHGLLQHTLRREIEGGALLISGIDPIDRVLPVPVLVVLQARVVVLHVAPQLPDGPRRRALLAVQAHELCRIALDEIEAPRIEADLELQPPEPNADALLDFFVRVVDVRRGVELAVELPRVVLAGAVGKLVAQRDRPTAPIHDAGEARPRLHARSELVPAALGILFIATSMVNDNVSYGPDAALVHGLDQAFERSLVAVLRPINVEKLRWQIALGGNGLRWRRQPDIGDAHVLHGLNLCLDDRIPIPSAGTPTFPIEALQHHGVVLVGRIDDVPHAFEQRPAGHPALHLIQFLALQLLHLL